MSAISKWKTTDFARPARCFFTTCTNTTVNFLLPRFWRTLTQEQIQLLLWVRTWVRSPRLHRGKLPIYLSLPSTSSLFRKWPFHFVFTANSYDQMRKSVRANCLHYKTFRNLQGVGFTSDFGFKIYWELTKSAPFQFGFTSYICSKNDETNPLTK